MTYYYQNISGGTEKNHQIPRSRWPVCGMIFASANSRILTVVDHYTIPLGVPESVFFSFVLARSRDFSTVSTAFSPPRSLAI
jgi:hypothetical protein